MATLKEMKTVFVLTASEDGIMPLAATNVKALFRLIESTGYEVTEIQTGSYDRITFNYANLLKEIRSNQLENRLYVATIYNRHGDDITVSEIGITSK